MSFLLVHGAFRGGWAWGPVARLLRAAGHRVAAPSLWGMGELTPPPEDRGHVGLDRWRAQVADLARLEDLHDVVLVGHSQGGLVARAAAGDLGGRLAAVAYLDAPIARRGQRGVDLLGDPPEVLPPADGWLEPRPLGVDDHHGPDLVAWVNDRLGPTPVGPSLDPVDSPEPEVPTHVAFCAHTAAGFPSTATRAEMDRRGLPYRLFDAPHDAPLTHPGPVADWLLGLTAG